MKDAKGSKILVNNNKIFYEYFVEDRIEAGIVLLGTEVKSIRNSSANISDAYIVIEKNEAFLINAHISHYKNSYKNSTHDPMRKKKLLLHKYQIKKLIGKIKEKGMTIVPISFINSSKNILKLEIGICKGKKLFDKRADKKKKDLERESRKEIMSD